jgi:hypothetical protein
MPTQVICKYATTNTDLENGKNTSVFSGVCFSGYLSRRIKEENKESGVLYTLACNKEMMEKLCSWFNKWDLGIRVSVKKTKKKGHLYSYRNKEGDLQNNAYVKETIYEDFKFGNRYIFRSGTKKEEVKTLPVDYCIVFIEVDATNITHRQKCLLEYLCLCIIRFLDYREDYLGFFGGKDEIIYEILNANSVSRYDVHKIYERRLTELQLLYCLNKLNMIKADKQLGYTPRQTDIFNALLKTRELLAKEE